jgi:uncharacterized membrane protein
MNPIVAIHLGSALAGLVLGIFVLARRKGTSSHRALGWTWVTLMASAAVSSVFLRDHGSSYLLGFSPIHAITVITMVALPRAIWLARRGDIAGHRKVMKTIYAGGCIVAGLFAFAPGRLLGDALWKSALGVLA